MAEPRIFTSPDGLKAAVGEKFGPGDWLPVDQDEVQLTQVVTVEREGGDKPVCVAESLSRYLW
ncbi:hypothetical protein [Streptomyces orinoci]|uniref:Uncharacterized protein n=1 Tax=Streptomyces orinoci TaxID=67339 RepID=A0ABV3K4E9_STRON|nr:hypothetical protein [Streptomyces orinoci]